MRYSLSDFRARMREAFNSAEREEEVFISRHGKLFRLELEGDEPPPETRKVVGVRKTVTTNLCEHFQPPGKCGYVGCKNA